INNGSFGLWFGHLCRSDLAFNVALGERAEYYFLGSIISHCDDPADPDDVFSLSALIIKQCKVHQNQC
ncbi:MAG: hypothetical protein ACRC80_26150, partial [Waterburya sp.]